MITIKPLGFFNQGFIVEGHANYAEHGQDVVCASVSVVTQMIAFELSKRDLASHKIKDSTLEVTIYNPYNETVISFIEMMLSALSKLEEQYPSYIKIEEEYYE